MSALAQLPLARLNNVVASALGEKVKRHKDKKTAIAKLAKVSKQDLVRALISTGGVTPDEIAALLDVSKPYAINIVAKLRKRGFVFDRAGLAYIPGAADGNLSGVTEDDAAAA